MATDPAAVRADEYPGSAVLGAVIATLFFPLISLIAALMLMSNQANERKRGQLRTWAYASGGWILAQVIIAVILFASIASSQPEVDRSGPCVGGPEIGADALQQPDGTFVFPCVFGGTMTMEE